MKIVVVRHAHRDDDANPHLYNPENRNNNCPISKKGQRETNLKWLTYFEDHHDKLVNIYVSPFLRAKQTANIISNCYESYFGEKPINIIDYNFCEGQNAKLPCFEDSLIKELTDNGIKIGETLKDIKNRVKASLNKIITTHDKNSTVMIVAHGIICGAILHVLLKDVDFHDDSRKDAVKFNVGDHCTLEQINDEWEIVDSSNIISK